MLVNFVLGDCPGCGGKQQFGNVSVQGDRILRGCKCCKYHIAIPLPKIRKKILYLDQFFFSNAFKKQDPRFELPPVFRLPTGEQFYAISLSFC